MDNNDMNFATVREMHAMELRIMTGISDLSLKLESCVGPLSAQVAESIRQSDRADRKATAAHARIDSVQEMRVKDQQQKIAWLVGWLVTAITGGYGVWRLFVELRVLQQ